MDLIDLVNANARFASQTAKQVFTIVALDCSGGKTGVIFTDGSVKIIDWVRFEREAAHEDCTKQAGKNPE